MKVLILAGGYGTRLSEETDLIPKPLVKIGDKPILLHIMKIYSHFGFNEFVVLLGYKGDMIENYFFNNNDVSCMDITFLDTGLNTDTGGRIKRAESIINGEPFMLTYGDGLADIDLSQLLIFHKNHGGLVTMTSVQLASRFGILDIGRNERVTQFKEKPKENEAWINGGFFICEPGTLNYIKNDSTIFEKDPLATISEDGKLFTYRHKGFWKCMDTLRDKRELDQLAFSSSPPWKRSH
ncbi:MAG: glucose-1-phosphate cytidylyltransferase [Candidatus Marinimicrobia bacterium]|nr:glucose-1-phosphate cytidylyltransferase [Candidatus Neomarinimicrobiota bacterium]